MVDNIEQRFWFKIRQSVTDQFGKPAVKETGWLPAESSDACRADALEVLTELPEGPRESYAMVLQQNVVIAPDGTDLEVRSEQMIWATSLTEALGGKRGKHKMETAQKVIGFEGVAKAREILAHTVHDHSIDRKAQAAK